MSLAKVSQLPSLNISELTKAEKERSYFEVSRLSSGVSPLDETVETWFSNHVGYADLQSDIISACVIGISAATSSTFGFVKLGAERRPSEYIFPLSLDSEGRAFTQTQKDEELKNLKYDRWQFVLSSGVLQTVTAIKYVVTADGPYVK